MILICETECAYHPGREVAAARVGGLVAWVVNKDKAPRRSRSMLVWGIVLTFLYPILWFGGFWVLALILGGVATVTLPW